MRFNLVYKIALISVTLSILSCGNHILRETKITQNEIVSDTVSDLSRIGNPIDYDSIKVLKNLYVTVRKGVDGKEQPSQWAKSIIRFGYGSLLNVIEINGDWLGVRESVLRKSGNSGREIETTRWEKVYVPKGSTGDAGDIKLIRLDLNIITALTLNNKTIEYEEGIALENYLEIELIDGGTFDRNKATEVDYLLADTNLIKKKQGVIRLPIKNGSKDFIDKQLEETENQEFSYLGQVKFLDSYVLSGTYWESWDYKFINKTTGKQEMTFIDYPFISPDKKTIICISSNPYNNTADLALYVIKENKIKLVMAASFKMWMPTIDKNSMYWSNDGFLYVKVLPASVWGFADERSAVPQFIKIKVLSGDTL